MSPFSNYGSRQADSAKNANSGEPDAANETLQLVRQAAETRLCVRKEFKHPVRCGVIAAITKAAFRDREKHLKGIGFVGRCVLVSFSYSDATKTPFSTGFRLHKHLRTLVQAHALYRGDTKVKMEDFEEIRRLSKFMNLDFHKI